MLCLITAIKILIFSVTMIAVKLRLQPVQSYMTRKSVFKVLPIVLCPTPVTFKTGFPLIENPTLFPFLVYHLTRCSQSPRPIILSRNLRHAEVVVRFVLRDLITLVNLYSINT